MISISYSIDEIFEIAEQIERNGAAFYRKAAEIAGSDSIRELFNDLAEQEDEHLRTFAEMRKKLVPPEASIAVYDKDEIVAIYLQALAGNEIFNTSQKPGELLAGKESASDILRIAIGKERDSIIYYAAVRSLMDNTEDKEKVEQIIREEQKHIEDITVGLEECQEKR